MDIEKLETDLVIEKGGTRVRDGLKKLCIRGDHDGEYDIEIWSKHSGAEIKWSGHIHREDFDRKEGSYWVWDYAKLSRTDMIKVGRWLIQKARVTHPDVKSETEKKR